MPSSPVCFSSFSTFSNCCPSLAAKSFRSKAVGFLFWVFLLNSRSSPEFTTCFRGGVRKFDALASKACLLAGGCRSLVAPSCKPASSLDRFEAAAATALNGELAALGILESGALRLDIAPMLYGAGDNNTAAMRNNAGHEMNAGGVAWEAPYACLHACPVSAVPHNDTLDREDNSKIKEKARNVGGTSVGYCRLVCCGGDWVACGEIAARKRLG